LRDDSLAAAGDSGALARVAARSATERARELDNMRVAAIVECEALIRRALRAPSTAEFPREGRSWDPEYSDSTVRISGNVDAENAFGAKLRQRWACGFKPQGTSLIIVDISLGDG